jgi:preprotein translocase SecE subunit
VAEAKKQPRRLKKTETVREKAEKAGRPAPEKRRRLRSTAGKAAQPIKRVAHVGRKEYYLPLPDNRFGRFLNKRRHVIPRFFREAWAELRDVTWPSRKETWKLTLAVFIFAIVFGLLIAVTDYGLDKLFKRVLLK